MNWKLFNLSWCWKALQHVRTPLENKFSISTLFFTHLVFLNNFYGFRRILRFLGAFFKSKFNRANRGIYVFNIFKFLKIPDWNALPFWLFFLNSFLNFFSFISFRNCWCLRSKLLGFFFLLHRRAIWRTKEFYVLCRLIRIFRSFWGPPELWGWVFKITSLNLRHFSLSSFRLFSFFILRISSKWKFHFVFGSF